MPQFDIIIYFTYYFTFISYILVLYFFITLFIMPFFRNIFNIRYIKKEINSLLNLILFFCFNFFKKELNLINNKIYYLFKYFKKINMNTNFGVFFLINLKLIKFIKSSIFNK